MPLMFSAAGPDTAAYTASKHALQVLYNMTVLILSPLLTILLVINSVFYC